MRLSAMLSATLLVATPSLGAPLKDFSDGTVTIQPTKLWTEPTKFADPIAKLEKGLDLKVLNYSTTGQWIKVATPAGREGWIPLKFTGLATKKIRPRGEGRLPASNPTELQKIYYAGAHLQYANQITVGKAHGFGLGFNGGYYLNNWFAPGLALSMDRFAETASNAVYKVQRTAYRYFIGPNAKFRHRHFTVDFSIGLDMVRSNFSIKDQFTGSSVSNRCAGTSNDTSFGINLRPAYLFPMGPTSQLEVFASYGAGFHGKDTCLPQGSDSIPQQIGAGVGITTPL